MPRLTFRDFLHEIVTAGLAPADVAVDLVAVDLQVDRPFLPSTDSRTLKAGEVFVCLRGPHFDGHDFISEAASKGCSAVVADNPEKVPSHCSMPIIVVRDAKETYLRGAAAARRRFRGLVVGITGSSGKTTTKEFATQLIGRHRRVKSTPHNENNELGVAKLCYELEDGAQVGVAEFGARHPGEILQLVEMAMPDVGVLTNVGEAHMEFFEDRTELARTKFALFARGARPVCSAADEWSRTLAAEQGIERSALWARLCGDPRVAGLALEAGVPKDGRLALTLGASHAFVPWHLVGEHHLRDAMLAAGAALQCGLPFEEAIAGFDDLHLPPGRFELHALRSGAVVVYDAYNANPTSVQHALRALGEIPATRRIAVLGSMAELGRNAPAQHEATGAAAARSGIDVLYCGGEYAQALATGALRAGMAPSAVSTFSSNTEVARELQHALRSGDAALLKGSRIQQMEEILHTLTSTEENVAVDL